MLWSKLPDNNSDAGCHCWVKGAKIGQGISIGLVQTLKVNQAKIRRILVRSEELIR